MHMMREETLVYYVPCCYLCISTRILVVGFCIGFCKPRSGPTTKAEFETIIDLFDDPERKDESTNFEPTKQVENEGIQYQSFAFRCIVFTGSYKTKLVRNLFIWDGANVHFKDLFVPPYVGG